jgi:ATP-binding cassette subfamily B (MDR/TAP) protein 7
LYYAKLTSYERPFHSPTTCSCIRFNSTNTRNLKGVNPKSSNAAALSEVLKPETLKKPAALSTEAPNGQSELLQEKTVSKAEQRKADWAIMKEMTRYLWPKV